jgi:mono/diheme cytochrome c family protein
MHLRPAIAALVVTGALLGACGGAATPEALTTGRTVYGDSCATCHGAAGDGGVGPALDAVTETWPTCDEHIEWITLGSKGWSAKYGDAYGAQGKPITGVMPAHDAVLSAEEIAAVAAYERITYGEADQEATLVECGLAQ